MHAIIGGAAVGAFMIAHGGKNVRGAPGGLRRVISGPPWKQEDYRSDTRIKCIGLLRTARQAGWRALLPDHRQSTASG